MTPPNFWSRVLHRSSGRLRRLCYLGSPLATAPLLLGCFQYVPAEYGPPPKPESEVRITLARPIDIPMGELTLNEVTTIEGIVTAADNDTLDLVARWLRPRLGRRFDANFSQYEFPVTDIGQYEKWTFSGKRTAVLVGVGSAVTVVALRVLWKVVRGDPITGGPPIPETSVVPAR